jgi:hypothetical protein
MLLPPLPLLSEPPASSGGRSNGSLWAHAAARAAADSAMTSSESERERVERCITSGGSDQSVTSVNARQTSRSSTFFAARIFFPPAAQIFRKALLQRGGACDLRNL